MFHKRDTLAKTMHPNTVSRLLEDP